jgi:hypothetical protein
MTGCAALEWYLTGVAGQAPLAAEASASSSEPYSCSTSIVTAPGSCRASDSDRARARSVWATSSVPPAHPAEPQARLDPSSCSCHRKRRASGRCRSSATTIQQPPREVLGRSPAPAPAAARASRVRRASAPGAVCRNESVERASRALPRPGAAVPVRPKCRPRIGPCSRGHRHEDNGDPCYTPITMTLLRARPAGPLVSRSPDAGRARRLSHLARRPGEGRATQAPAQRPL